jgi:hypothetical protein
MKRVLIIDTSILCIWLDVPGMATCGPAVDKWDKQRVDQKRDEELTKKTTFVLPLASIIETGNHISQASHSRKKRGEALADLMRKSADEESPWVALSDQSVLWSAENRSLCGRKSRNDPELFPLMPWVLLGWLLERGSAVSGPGG